MGRAGIRQAARGLGPRPLVSVRSAPGGIAASPRVGDFAGDRCDG